MFAGGAISLVASPGAYLSQVLFLDNTAQVTDLAAEVAYACSGGYGGAMCIFGTSRSSIVIQAGLFINNSATFGGGVSLSADPSCTTRQLSTGCFFATFDDTCNFTSNTALGGAGGAIFWTHPGNLNMSCKSSRLVPQPSYSLATSFPSAPDVELPCSSWLGNQISGAGYGPVIASSSFFIQPQTSDLTYYTSNQPLPLTVVIQVGR